MPERWIPIIIAAETKKRNEYKSDIGVCQTPGAKSCQQLGNEKLPVGSEGPRAILCQ